MPLPLNPSTLNYVNKTGEYMQNQPLVIDVFGTYCGPCRETLPGIAQAAQMYQGVYFVAVSFEDVNTVGNFLYQMPEIRGMNVACDNGGVNLLCNVYGIRGIPHCFVFDRAGNLFWHGHPGDAACAQAVAQVSMM